MLFFRSEEHAQRWREEARPPTWTVLSLDQIARLGHAWYARRLAADWRRHTPEEAESLFAELGLDPVFWRLR